ncbi:MAG: PAS domain S-box protein [Anaerolineales bacterium]|nr:PAS domain S-box protein [Anaerolineales bacterium]
MPAELIAALRTENEALRRQVADLQAAARREQTAKQAEVLRQLAVSENQLRSFIESQNAFLVRIDLEGNYRFANPAFLRHFGFERDQLIGLPSLDTVMQDDWAEVRANG